MPGFLDKFEADTGPARIDIERGFAYVQTTYWAGRRIRVTGVLSES